MPVVLMILIMILVGCGEQKEQYIQEVIAANTPHKVEIDSELDPYVMEFLRLCRQYNNKGCLRRAKTLTEIEYRPKSYLVKYMKSESVVGFCEVFSGFEYTGQRRIVISESMSGQYHLKQLMFHELFHCLAGLDHSDDPEDIMYPNLIRHPYDNWDAKVERAFNR